MNTLLFSTTFFWLFAASCELLFWLYLWQLKEYHPGRMKAHLSTRKGQSIILSPKRFLSAILVLFPLLLPFDFFVLIGAGFFFALRALYFSYKFFRGRLLRPVFTKRTLATLLAGLLLIYLFTGLSHYSFQGIDILVAFLCFDIFIPLIFSLLVFSFQPLVFLWQKNLLKKAKKKRKNFKDLEVVAVTGSYGKSSAKNYLSRMFAEKYKVLKTKKNLNSEVGVSRAILNELTSEHEVFVCEIGAYEKGKIAQVADAAGPQVGILTGVNRQHLATFGSQEDIVRAKFEIVESLPEGGTVILNWDSSSVRNNAEKYVSGRNLKTVKVSALGEADVRAEGTRVEKESLSFDILFGEEEKISVKANLVGKQNVINILLAAAVARELGVSSKRIKKAVAGLEPPGSGMSIKKGKGGVDVIDDTYSANPHGVKAALEHLKLWQGKKILVMPCLIELGGKSAQVHKELGKLIGEVCDLAVITKPDCFKQIKKGTVKSRLNKVFLLRDTERIYQKIKPFLEKEGVVLFESRVPDGLVKKLVD